MKTIAQKFLSQDYIDYNPEWGVVQTIAFDDDLEISFKDGSYVWANQFGFREGKHPSRFIKLWLQESTPNTEISRKLV